MTSGTQLVSDRLRLRPWHPRDLAPFTALNTDPAVMRFFPALLPEPETAQAMERYNTQLTRDGFTMWAAEDLRTGHLLGVIGAQTMSFAIPDLPQPAVEIGWRLATHAQRRGLATEGARAVLQHLCSSTSLAEVVAITTPGNVPSRHVMDKLGMQHDPALTFEHPRIAEGSPFRTHVLYRLPLTRT